MAVTLKRLTNSVKNVRMVFELLNRQPRRYYQAWGYSEPTMTSVASLLASSPVYGVMLDDKFVGIIGLTYKSRYFIQKYSGQFWIHYLVDKEHSGRGIATQAVSQFLDIIRTTTPITRVYAGIYSDNQASIHLIQKFGFVERENRAQTQVFEKKF